MGAGITGLLGLSVVRQINKKQKEAKKQKGDRFIFLFLLRWFNLAD
jgi:hypothetical protein